MKTKIISISTASMLLFSCHSNQKQTKPSAKKDTSTSVIDDSQLETVKTDIDTNIIHYSGFRETLKFTTSEVIERKKEYYFSNTEAKDTFILTIEPGMVKNSKAIFKIINPDKKILYEYAFDAFYFLREIDEPQSYPPELDSEQREVFTENYWKSLTQKQYSDYFYANVNNFFETIIERNFGDNELNELKEYVLDKNFYEEILEDRTIPLYDITNYDSDEGSSLIGFSKTQNKVIILSEQD